MEILIIICTAIIFLMEIYTQNQNFKNANLLSKQIKEADENAERRHREILSKFENRT